MRRVVTAIFIGIVGLIFGVSIGLVYTYWINPVKWVDLSIADLRVDLQEDYLRLAIESHYLHNDQAKALQRWTELGDSGPNLLPFVTAFQGLQSFDDIASFQDAIALQASLSEACDCSTSIIAPNYICFYLWVATFFGGIAVTVYFLRRLRHQEALLQNYRDTASPPQPPKMEPAVVSDLRVGKPLIRYVAKYTLGDNLFSDAQAVLFGDTFWGEAGIEILQAFTENNTKKVLSFEVWLFDKLDIHTNTIVLMSSGAYSDPDLRKEAAAKGAPQEAKIGAEYELQSMNMTLVCRILDLKLEANGLNHQETFNTLSIEISIYPKQPRSTYAA